MELVRARIDWKYLLGLALTDPGFDFSKVFHRCPQCTVRESNHGNQLQRAHFPKDIMRMGVRWYVAYPLSYRQVEELMEG